MRFMDAHVHLDDEKFDGDREEIIKNFHRDGVELVVNASCDLETSKKSVALIAYENVYCVIGVHPHEAKTYLPEHMACYEEMLTKDKVLGVGECGLDYHYDFSDRPTQKKVFEIMIDLANRKDVPLVIHSREAVKDTQDMLFSLRKDGPTLIHCFTGAKEVAREYINQGYYLSIGGALTFKNARHVVESVDYAPMEHILLETDAPYMTPVPFRGKRNEPKYITHVVDKIAEIKGLPREEVIRICNENTRKFYRL
ncbi:MAG: TatD family hydrolase [Tissierellia bacterium]|nr:TatD family hydrolase [Tissierellia bacterium]